MTVKENSEVTLGKGTMVRISLWAMLSGFTGIGVPITSAAVYATNKYADITHQVADNSKRLDKLEAALDKSVDIQQKILEQLVKLNTQ